MFHFDCTMEDVRIIATEHRVALSLEEREQQTIYAPDARTTTKHDGTFDVLHVDGVTGQSYTVNLTAEELAAVLRVGISGDDSSEAYASMHIQRYQSLMKDHHFLSFIP